MDLAESDTYDEDSENRTQPDFIISQDNWLSAEATYKLQDTNLQVAQASLSQSWYSYQLYQGTITAPVDGTIIGLNLAPGLSVSYTEGNSGGAANQTVATIKTSGKPIASFTVTDIDISKIIVDQSATIVLDSFPDETYGGKVVAVDRVGSVTNGVTQYTVLIQIDSESSDILSNMSATATIVLEKKDNAIIVPSSALIQSPRGESIVRIIKDGKVQPVQVETGIENDTEIEITSGLSEGDQVVVTSATSTTVSSEKPAQRETFIMGAPGGAVRGTGTFRGRD